MSFWRFCYLLNIFCLKYEVSLKHEQCNKSIKIKSKKFYMFNLYTSELTYMTIFEYLNWQFIMLIWRLKSVSQANDKLEWLCKKNCCIWTWCRISQKIFVYFHIFFIIILDMHDLNVIICWQLQDYLLHFQ